VIVCLCEGVSEARIVEEIKQGARTIEDIQQACGAGSHCGSCLFLLVEMLDKKIPLAKSSLHDKAKFKFR